MRSYTLFALGWPLFLSRGAIALDLTPESAGARVGFPGNSHAEHFFEGEACATWKLPWRWTLGSDWNFKTRLDTSAGWLQDRETDAFIGMIGPGLVLIRDSWPVHFVAGSDLTFLSRDEFPDKDLGIPVQFTTYAAVEWDLTARFRLQYRFTHMSNGGLDSHNPGLDFHLVGLSYVF